MPRMLKDIQVFVVRTTIKKMKHLLHLYMLFVKYNWTNTAVQCGT